ncbi:MAG: hypothetical protein SV765_00290 [Pseudomonadota bacterium]|nr:hypothetical protein [Pseudomonadota bacterium]
MKNIIRLPLALILFACLASCSTIKIYNFTDENPAFDLASDHGMIRTGISEKSQTYKLDKAIYKKKYRLDTLKEFARLSRKLLALYQSNELQRSEYNSKQKEIKYVIQRSIHMMKDEDKAPENQDDDVIYKYLIEALGDNRIN